MLLNYIIDYGDSICIDFIVGEYNNIEDEKIKKDSQWSIDTEEDVFDEVHKESHGFKEAVALLETLINKICIII